LTLNIWKRITEPDSLTLILTAAFLLRLVIIPFLYDDYNYWAFGVFTSFLTGGNNPYHIVANDPTLLDINPWRYPPLYLAFTTPAFLAKTVTGSTLVYLATLKIPLAIADVISAFYIFKILLLKFPRNTALKFTALYAFNPLVIFESAGGGFNDPIPIAFTVISFYYLLISKGSEGNLPRTNLYKSAFFLGLGIATKIYPLLLLPVFLREIRGSGLRLPYALLAFLPIGILSAPFLIWDFGSYTSLLTIRNVGGQHPLFPLAGIPGIVGPVATSLVVLILLWTYLKTLKLTTRIVLVFLWVNIAVFAQSFNYMLWGVPFFTIFIAEQRKLYGISLSAGITFAVALVFQGSYNGASGATGLYYWSYHLLHQQIVVFREFPFSTVDPLILVTSGLVAGVLLNAYYFLAVIRVKTTLRPDSTPVESTNRVTLKNLSKGKLVLPIFLCALVILSWGAVITSSSFENHHYPVVQESSFQFKDNFHSTFLDYQWVFDGGGNYSINAAQGNIDISDTANSTGYIFRGWAGLIDGFHQSDSWTINFLFRFENFLSGRNSMVLANMTDGILLVLHNQTTTYLSYSDQVNNGSIQFSQADNNWHNFTEQYSQGRRTLQIDNTSRILAGGRISKLIFGDFNSGRSFGGRAQISAVTVLINDFPVGHPSANSIGLGLVLPVFSLIAVYALLVWNQRIPFRRNLPASIPVAIGLPTSQV
jgi:hypothetical protein